MPSCQTPNSIVTSLSSNLRAVNNSEVNTSTEPQHDTERKYIFDASKMYFLVTKCRAWPQTTAYHKRSYYVASCQRLGKNVPHVPRCTCSVPLTIGRTLRDGCTFLLSHLGHSKALESGRGVYRTVPETIFTRLDIVNTRPCLCRYPSALFSSHLRECALRARADTTAQCAAEAQGNPLQKRIDCTTDCTLCNFTVVCVGA
jgi:hypothetical protein